MLSQLLKNGDWIMYLVFESKRSLCRDWWNVERAILGPLVISFSTNSVELFLMKALLEYRNRYTLVLWFLTQF